LHHVASGEKDSVVINLWKHALSVRLPTA